MPYRDETLVCVEIGSYETRAIFGLAESLTPPKLRLKTQVGKRLDSEEYLCGEGLQAALDSEPQPSIEVIRPIVHGHIQDWSALTAFFTHVLQVLGTGLAGTQVSEHPVILVVPPQWSNQDREKVTQLFLRNFLRPAFMIVDMPFASLYACNAVTGTVIDVGYEDTNVTTIIDSVVNPSGHRSISLGGKSMTLHLLEMLQKHPPLEQNSQVALEANTIGFDLAEAIKCSSICEILPDTLGSNTMAFQTGEPAKEEEEGVLDIAAVVASGKTREYLARIQAGKDGNGSVQEEVPNAQLTHNNVKIKDQTLVIGNDRFKVADVLLEDGPLLDAIHDAIANATIEPIRRRELWENIVVVGGGARIKGFREKLILNLQLRFASKLTQASADPYAPALYNAYPVTIRSIKIPIHFPEWNGKSEDEVKKGINEEATFLGGCIIAHIAFSSSETSGSARLYSTMADYSEAGPVVDV
ncbi:SWI/SNF and RSC complex subunit Arp95 / FY16936)) [Taphrina deformans PYCC 5710]|uniref:SWI/SNF and RSC complex subunit Arp95 / FY16936 n=1 Tax=Taphrina deformans (strain PYCC 5710 / ATCC 11124 / CBS 356.35 / IMI 108563 / JCM 9778 / NBRC 8474) TaxID=1097556 RepID=R4X7F0_TAPDE|nr:SWI/SNF and RSC complex subunit Arp95 / FY16936)) [Taphrina deformans PYCC 5710]|eukprot:CCG81300.1 SWI/SNF and RSC complex subunit Arp95 / FY16936)) [Taphrina deformans PYCC 5710]